MNANVQYWGEFMSLGDIFENINSGVQTERDHLVLHYEKESLNNLLANFKRMDTAALREFYKEKDDGRDWHLDWARQSVVENTGTIQLMHYRPFDFRWTYYTPKSKEFLAYPRHETMQYLIGHDNIGFAFTRKNRQLSNGYFLISNYIMDRHVLDSAGDSMVIAPLYLYGNKGEGTLGLEEAQKPNWTPAFAKFLSSYHCQHPEQLLAYMYAILYAPSYRSAYGEDLSYDYPRIPFTADTAKFAALAELGQRLINLHLLKTAPQTSAGYPVDGGHMADKPVYSETEDRLYINNTQYFSGVPKEVWEYQIGGYQVLDKYLKARKGRALTLDEISHFQRVCGILADTIKIQKEIDTVEGVW